jgi:hypothetical protein
MTERKDEQTVISPLAEGVIQHSPEIEEKPSEGPEGTVTHSLGETSIANEKLEELAATDDTQSIMSLQGSKTNFGFLPVPERCRVSPTKPYKFNLATNILFGFASTFTVCLSRITTDVGCKSILQPANFDSPLRHIRSHLRQNLKCAVFNSGRIRWGTPASLSIRGYCETKATYTITVYHGRTPINRPSYDDKSRRLRSIEFHYWLHLRHATDSSSLNCRHRPT